MSDQGELFTEPPTFAARVLDVPVAEEMSESFLAYSLSVITSRAIPDVRDGLKPVQRRILYAMEDMGLRPDRPHRKCAGVVGETMGKYHPHGDGAIYDALTRMGQDFSRVVTLIDPHGNFGSLDDPPAAYRYTECRLTPAAQEMLAELDEDTVEFRPTFDGQRDEPVVLPGRLPNLLVNGTSGIAVGMATNMASHNLREVADLVELVMTKRRPQPTIEEIMAVLPGPDFPSGGIVVDDGLAEAYATGRGTFRIRATAEITKVTKNRQGIVVTELPYQVGPERVLTRTQDLIRDGKISGISDVKNLSDRTSGLRLVFECKAGVNPKAVLTELYRQTPLEESFGINNVVLVNGVPTTMGVARLAQHYIDHRLEVIFRRTEHRLARAQSKLHLLEGRMIALDAIDLVVSIIRSSHDTPEARERLMAELSLSEIQATDILEMPLRRLTALARLELEGEIAELREAIADFELILSSEQRRRTLVLKELRELVDAFGRDRRTRIVSPEALSDVTAVEAAASDEPATDEPCVVALSSSGVVGVEPVGGPKAASFGRHDVLIDRVTASTQATVWGITSGGRAVSASVAEIDAVAGRSRGSSVGDAFGLERGEVLLRLVAPARGDHPGGASAPLLLVSARGQAKRITIEELVGTRPGQPAMKLKDGDSLVDAFEADDDTDVVIVASDAQALRTSAANIAIQGRTAGGVAGMKLTSGATVVGAGPVVPGAVVISVTDAQTAKATDVAALPAKGRATGGVRLTKFRGEKRLDWAWVGPENGRLVVVGQEENPSRPDTSPEPLTLEITGRDLISHATTRRWLGIGTGRW
ncbi:MAG: DNA gyrase/topoisomerase IV subunit A [Candidatus Neomicrothrix subdominans]|nr:DNA topoisomerase IV subunit A [Candidatus Microthrix sp.]MBP7596580.1 DNA topoisomerase IV subunit A [Candidatus Microthrix sp.]MBP9065949.1 DNA topoisomerase IV subunit A [Candidatus Microthrix sp.]